jgi:hypothetical protein
MKKLALIGGVFVLLFICYVLSATVAMDYGDSAASGNYSLAQNDETSMLVLRPDHTFRQDLSHLGNVQHAEGTWHRFGEGGSAFSKEFLVVSGQEPSAHGIAYAEMHKTLGLFVSLVLSNYHVLWYGRVDISPDDKVTGIYAGDEEGAPATLVLNVDRTFEQTITHEGVSKHAKGSWNLSQSGDIIFSKEFLKTNGEALRDDETASAWDPKGSNLQIKIARTFNSGGPPTYRKKLFPW